MEWNDIVRNFMSCHLKQRKDSWQHASAVSPVIATILMVAITVVLAGVLVVYLNTLPSGSGKIEPPIGLVVEKTREGNWTLTIVNGQTQAINTNLQVLNKATGQKTILSPITAQSWYFKFNDNDANNMLNAGDSILLNQTPGMVQVGFVAQLLKSDSIISGPGELRDQ
jgi:flagellin-like protein